MEVQNTGTQNTLGDLTNHLFAELERLGDESMDAEQLDREIERARAITGVASQVISNARTMLDAVRLRDDANDANMRLPRMLSDGGR